MVRWPSFGSQVRQCPAELRHAFLGVRSGSLAGSGWRRNRHGFEVVTGTRRRPPMAELVRANSVGQAVREVRVRGEQAGDDLHKRRRCRWIQAMLATVTTHADTGQAPDFRLRSPPGAFLSRHGPTTGEDPFVQPATDVNTGQVPRLNRQGTSVAAAQATVQCGQWLCGFDDDNPVDAGRTARG